MFDKQLLAAIADCPSISLISSAELAGRSDEAGLSLVKIAHPEFEALISVQGAQLLSMKPRGASDLLWLSPLAEFSAGKAIRGGIPVCAPWFGVNQRQAKLPKHGFFRNCDWRLESAQETVGGVSLVWSFLAAQDAPGGFSAAVSAKLTMVLSDKIELNFSIVNISNEVLPISWALHSYHPAGDVGATVITGVNGCEYLDNTDALSRKRQSGDIHFCGELDRVYLKVPQRQTILPAGISVTAENAPTAIIWNPGESLGRSMTDVGEFWNRFVCLERGAAFDDEIQLTPGQSVQAKVEISHG